MIHFRVSDKEFGVSFWLPTAEQAKAILNRDCCKALSLGVSLDLYLESIKSPAFII